MSRAHRPRITRRSVFMGVASVLRYRSTAARRATAQPPAVNVGVVLPLSGRQRPVRHQLAQWHRARGGRDQRQRRGQGPGGAKINLVVADATSTPTTAATVAQRLITQNDVTAILGAFASSLTIAISEVTERRDIPLLTMSFADQITGRGFKNIFQVVAKASAIGKAQFDYTLAIAGAAGQTLEKVAIMYEDTAYGTAQAGGLARRRQGGRHRDRDGRRVSARHYGRDAAY